MSAITALEAEIRRVLSQSQDMRAEFGSPIRLVEGEAARAAFPFIRLARHETRPDLPVPGGSVEHRISLEVLSRHGGRDTAGSLVSLIADVLRGGSLEPEGHRIILFYPVFLDVFLRADGSTYRGLLRLRALTEANEVEV